MMRRLAIAAIAAALIVPSAFIGGASAEPSVVREAIVSELGPDGAVNETKVAQLIHLEADEGSEAELRIPNVDDLESYRNLSGFRGPEGEGDDIVWKTSDDLNARSLSGFKGKLPLDVAVRYFLDGKEISASEIKRQSGKVRIEIDLENVSGSTKNLKHKGVTSPFLTSFVTQFVPLEYSARVEFPSDRWSNVTGQGARIGALGESEVVAASGILSPPLTDAKRTLVFEGKSDDILTPRIQVFAVPGLSTDVIDALEAQYEALLALYDGTGTIAENMTKIHAGTLELVDGVEEMLAGVGANDPVTGKPIVTLGPDGQPTTVLGALGALSQGLVDQIIPGIGKVDPNTGKGVIVKDKDGKTTTLLGGLQTQQDTYVDDLIPGMETLIAGIDQLVAGIEGGAPELVGGLSDLEDGVSELLDSLQSGDLNDPGLVEGLQLISGGLSQLLAGLGNSADPANNVTVIGAVKSMTDGLTQLIAGLGNTADPANSVTVIGAVKTMSAGVTSLLTNMQGGVLPLIGSLQADIVNANTLYGASDPALFGAMVFKVGQLATAFGNGSLPPNQATVIGGVQLVGGGLTQLLGSLQTNNPGAPGFREGMQALAGGLAQLLGSLQTNSATTPGFREGLLRVQQGAAELLDGVGDISDPASPATLIGVLKLIEDGLGDAGPGAGALVDSVLGALAQMKGGLTNPDFTKKQKALDGKTPKAYFADCPACFDPDSDRFDEATSDPRFQPRFLEVFNLFSEGITAALPKLDSLDADAPGLVDGLEQVVGGLDKLASKLQTFDPKDPGLVDAIDLVRGGLEQVGAGIYTLNELGVSNMRGKIGDQGDSIAMDEATLAEAAARAGRESVLGSQADVVSATYVFDLAAQSTAGADNLRRGALMGFVLMCLSLLAGRMRRFEL